MSELGSRVKFRANSKVWVELVPSDPLHRDILADMALVDGDNVLLDGVRAQGTILRFKSPHYHVDCPALEEVLFVKRKDLIKQFAPDNSGYFVVVQGQIKTVQGLFLPCVVPGYHRDKADALREQSGANSSPSPAATLFSKAMSPSATSTTAKKRKNKRGGTDSVSNQRGGKTHGRKRKNRRK